MASRPEPEPTPEQTYEVRIVLSGTSEEAAAFHEHVVTAFSVDQRVERICLLERQEGIRRAFRTKQVCWPGD